MDLDYLFYLVVLIITHFVTPGSVLFLRLITADSLFCTYRFFRTFVNKKLTESQIVSHTKSLYIRSIFDRHIFYFLFYAFYKFMCWFLWVSDLGPFYYLMVLVTVPPITNRLMSGELYQDIKRRKEYLIKMIASKMFAMSIRFFSRNYLHRDVKVKSREVFPLLEDYDNTTHYITEVGKNAGLILVLAYVKNYSPNFYYKMMKYVYNYKTGNMLVSYNELSAKKMLNNIVDEKRWDQLLKPNVYRAIFCVFHMNTDRSEIVKRITTDFNFSVFKFGTVWTVSSFVGNIFSISALSMFFVLYRNGMKTFRSWAGLQKIGIVVLGTVIGYLTENLLVASLITQFGYMLLVNKLSITIGKYLVKKSWKRSKFVYYQNACYLSPILMSGFHIMAFSYFIDVQSYTYLFLHLVYLTLISHDGTKLTLFCTLLLTSSLSEFNPLHIFYNMMIIYIGIGKMDFSVFEGLIEHVMGVWDHDWSIFGSNEYKSYDQLTDEFDYMDTDKFPSVSRAPNRDFIVRKNCENHDHLNGQKIENHMHNSSIAEEFDPNIFDLPKDKFIQAIGVTENDELVEEAKEEDESEITFHEEDVQSLDGKTYTIRRSTGSNSFSLIQDFC